MATAITPTSARRQAPAGRLTVTSLPSLDPVQASQLNPFFDTMYAIACRLVADAPELQTATAA